MCIYVFLYILPYHLSNFWGIFEGNDRLLYASNTSSRQIFVVFK